MRNPAFRPLPDDWRRAYAERIRLEVDDSPGAASRVLNGERLVLGSTTVPASVATAATHRKQLTRVVMPATEYVGLNPTMPPFDRLDVRKAAIAAVDRQALLDAVRENGGILASHWLPPGTPGHDQAGGAEGPRYDWLARPEGDLAVAQAYLRRAGFADGRYEGRPIVAFTAGDHRSMVVAQAVRRRLALIGMDLRLRVVPAAVARDACSDPGSGAAICPEAELSSPVRDPEALLRPGFVEAPAWSQTGTADLAAVMTLASDTRPGAQRARAWGDIGRDVVAIAPGAPWRWDERLLLVSRDVRGVVDGGSGGWDLAATSLAPERGAAEEPTTSSSLVFVRRVVQQLASDLGAEIVGHGDLQRPADAVRREQGEAVLLEDAPVDDVLGQHGRRDRGAGHHRHAPHERHVREVLARAVPLRDDVVAEVELPLRVALGDLLGEVGHRRRSPRRPRRPPPGAGRRRGRRAPGPCSSARWRGGTCAR